MCNILTQHLGDTTKAFEELLRANDIDYYMGQSFREQLAQSSALAQRVSAKMSGRESPASLYVIVHSHRLPLESIHCLITLKQIILYPQEIILKIQMRRQSCSPSGQCSFTLCVCVLSVNFMLVNGKYQCV